MARRIQLTVDADFWDHLSDLAKKTGKSVSAYLRQSVILNEYLQEKQKEHRIVLQDKDEDPAGTELHIEHQDDDDA